MRQVLPSATPKKVSLSIHAPHSLPRQYYDGSVVTHINLLREIGDSKVRLTHRHIVCQYLYLKSIEHFPT